MEGLLKLSIKDIFYLLLLIVVVFGLWYASHSYATNIVSYYISGDSDFKHQVRKILTNTGWRTKYKIYETDNKKQAIITINLTPREDMRKWHDKPQYYANGKQIHFSITTQDYDEKPQIFIDQDNWIHGVSESGLTIDQYREYVINHEFGHGLGYGHQLCVGRAKPDIGEKTKPDIGEKTNICPVIGEKTNICPVMYQMTRGVPAGGIPNYKVLDADFTKRLTPRYAGII